MPTRTRMLRFSRSRCAFRSHRRDGIAYSKRLPVATTFRPRARGGWVAVGLALAFGPPNPAAAPAPPPPNLTLLQAAVRRNPADAGTRRRLIVELIAGHHERQAATQLLALLDHPAEEWTLAWAQREYAHLASLAGEVPERLNTWRRRYRMNPGDPVAVGMVAELLHASERTGEAVQSVSGFVDRSGRSERSLRLAAATYECFGAYAQALEVYAELLQFAPHNRAYLGAPDGWMAVIRDRRAAWNHVRERLAQDDSNPFLHTLAGDYARELRDYAAAAKHYRDAVNRGGGVYARLRLAEALKALRKWNEAASLYRRVAAAPDVFIDASHRSRPEAQRRLRELEQGAAAHYGDHVSAHLGETVTGSGLELVERSDSVTVPATLGGRDCRRTDSSRGGYFFRFRVNDRFLFEVDRPVVLEFDYFDKASGKGKCTVSYDSTDPTGSWMPVRNGRDKEPACFYRRNTNRWKTAVFHLPDARFGNRLEDYTDFRIRSFGDNFTGGDLYIGDVRLRLEKTPPSPARHPAGPVRVRTISLADLPAVPVKPYHMDDCRLDRITKNGERCLRLAYDLPRQPVGDYAWCELIVDQPLPAPPRRVGIRMDPRGSLCEASFRIRDRDGEFFQMKLTYQMRGYGWTVVSRPLDFLGASWGRSINSRIDYPARIASLLIDTSRCGRDVVLLKDLLIEEPVATGSTARGGAAGRGKARGVPADTNTPPN